MGTVRPEGLPTQESLAAEGWRRRALPGFIGLIGPLWTRKEPSGWAYGVLTTVDHENPASVVHGGLMAALIDHALSTIAWEATGRRACLTVQLDTHFIAAARAGQFLEARGRVVKVTSQLVFMQGNVSVGEQELVVASAVLKVASARSGDDSAVRATGEVSGSGR